MVGIGATSSSRFDFSNPIMAAAIVTADGSRFPLWTRLDPKKNAKLAQGLRDTRALSFLQEITIEVQLALLPIIKATLTPPYRDAINFIDSDLMEWGQSRLEVQYGYLSNTTSQYMGSTIYSGILLKPEITLGHDVTIILSAQGVSAMSAARQGGTRTFTAASRKEIVTAIAEGRTANRTALKASDLGPTSGRRHLDIEPFDHDKFNGVPRDFLRSDPARGSLEGLSGSEYGVVASSTSKPPNAFGSKTREVEVDDKAVTSARDSEAYRLWVNSPITYAQGGRTDWQAIHEIATEAQCYTVWEGSTLKILPRYFIYISQDAQRTFRLYDYPGGRIGPASGTFPILGASSPNMAIYLPAETRGLHMQDVNSQTREVEKATVDEGFAAPPRSGEGGYTMADSGNYPSTDPDTGDGGKTFYGSPSDEQAVLQAKSEYADSSARMGVNLNIESLADPTLLPGHLIQVRGLGRRLDNTKYVVFKVTTTIGTSGATMSLETHSNAAAVAEHVGAKGPVAKQNDVKEEDKKLSIAPLPAGDEGIFGGVGFTATGLDTPVF